MFWGNILLVVISFVSSGIYSTFRYIGSTIASVIIGLQFSVQLTFAILLCGTVVGIIAARGFAKATN